MRQFKSIRPIINLGTFLERKNFVFQRITVCHLSILFTSAIVEMLLMGGSNVNDQSGEHCSGITPLHDAAANGHIEVVKLLLAHGASITLKDNNVSLLSHWYSA